MLQLALRCSSSPGWQQPRRAARSQARPWQPSAAPLPARLHRAVAAAVGAGGQPSTSVQLTLPNGTKVALPQSTLVIGSGADADLQLAGSGVAMQHARLEAKAGRLYCTALTGCPDDLLAPTACWLDGVELRPGVSYMVAPGARLTVGTQENCITCSFQEGGSSAMAEMLLKGLAASASKEVQEKLQGGL